MTTEMQFQNPDAPNYDWQKDREWFNQRLAKARIHNSELEQEVARLRIDAKRYRWLRDHIALTICARIDKTITHGTPEKMDELIDSRRAR